MFLGDLVTIPFKWLMVDPLVAIKAIYKEFNWNYENLAERKLYLRENPAGMATLFDVLL
jgi:hypothetical protein